MAYSPDGSTVAVGQNDGGFLILDSESLEKIVGFKDRKEGISDVKFSPGNSALAFITCIFKWKMLYNVPLFVRITWPSVFLTLTEELLSNLTYSYGVLLTSPEFGNSRNFDKKLFELLRTENGISLFIQLRRSQI